MPISQLTRSAIAVVIALTTTSCGPFLFYSFQDTHTYEYERRAPIVVRSDPAGATIITSDGTILGEAPMIVDAKVRVRRSHHYRNVKLLTLGCVVDLVASAFLIDYSIKRNSIDLDSEFTSGQSVGLARSLFDTFAGFAGAGLGGICGGILMILSSKRLAGPIDTDERIIPNTLELTARWDGLGDVHAQLDLPATRTSTLQLPRTYTFEESVVLWARETAPPPTDENLYRVGDAYRILALRGVHGAMERAVEFFTRYLQLHPAAKHAANVRHALDELRPPGGRER